MPALSIKVGILCFFLFLSSKMKDYGVMKSAYFLKS